MSKPEKTIARRIQSFVDNPLTNLVKGLALLFIGVANVSRTFRADLSHGTVRIGHGMMIIGFFGVLGALPHLIDSLQAGGRFLELRAAKERAKNDSGRP